MQNKAKTRNYGKFVNAQLKLICESGICCWKIALQKSREKRLDDYLMIVDEH